MSRDPERAGDTIADALRRLEAVYDFDRSEAATREIERQERAQARSERAERLRRSGFGLRRKEFDAITGGSLDLGRTKAIHAVARWRAKGHDYPVLVLQGPYGCGKSVAAAWYVAEHPSGGLLRTATQVASAWRSDTNKAAEAREDMCECAVLVLDDIGTEIERQTDSMAAALRELLESRQALRTIITTNLTQAQWRARYPDERIASRMQRAAWVVADGPDLRGSPP